ncbi:MAG: preprotein translocase subunit SecA, partial [Candidatus Omnitrophica bacterium]|nr:preprotein translocase subunit SecA [Candidatus Omnitrophota bacterium]
LRPASRQQAYATDIVYGQNNEFGFDYLRDNMRFRREDLVQREFHYAIVDEVDSILIDEARTPLIISGPAEESTDLYYRLDKLIRRLTKAEDYEVDEKEHAVSLTEKGIQHCEEMLSLQNLYDETNMRLIHHIQQALRAHELYRKDVDYMIKDNEIIIVDEFTGRLMPGRRWSDGLHQAIEAKENVRIRQENQTLASVTFQNYFRMYEKLAGMTGTASTEVQEFSSIYSLDVVSIPTNQPLIRSNFPDVVFKTEEEKFVAVVEEIVSLHRAGQPILVGTISIEKSEHLSRLLKEPAAYIKRLGTVCQWGRAEIAKTELPEELKDRLEKTLSRPATLHQAEVESLLSEVKAKQPKSLLCYRLEQAQALVRTIAVIREGLPHHVLNAKYHEMEARIVSQAGRKGAITIATNMAGRGTDILLGGNPQALAEEAIREEEEKRQSPLEESERQEILQRFQKLCAQEHDDVVSAGGLHVLGTERHEARRIDNQLRGRSGRQGDPGSSRFYLSLADDLMRIFGSERIARLMDFKWMQWEEGLPLEHGIVSRAIEASQRRVEGHNFEIRKQLLEYDNTMNRQREVIYEQRRRILEGVDMQGLIQQIMKEVSEGLGDAFFSSQLSPDAWNLEGLRETLSRQFAVSFSSAEEKRVDREQLLVHIQELFQRAYEAKTAQVGSELMAHLERTVLLSVIDAKWKDHLYMMDALREGIHLRAYGQRDPLVEYQREAYRMFQDLIVSIKEQALTMLLRVQPTAGAEPVSVFAKTPHQELHPQAADVFSAQPQMPSNVEMPAAGFPEMPPTIAPKAAVRQQTPAPQPSGAKVGRNEPCPCGSG